MMTLRGWMGGSLVLTGAMVTSACTTDVADDGADGTALATVNLPNGNVVQFFELMPGLVDIAQQTPLGVAPVETGSLRPVEVFARIAPGEPVPVELSAAEARLDAMRALRPAHNPTSAKPMDEGAGFAPLISDTDFANKYCTSEGGDFPIHLCHTSQTADHWGIAYDIDAFKVTLCVNSGKVRLTVRIEDQLKSEGDYLSGCITHGYYSGGPNWNNFTDQVTVEAAGTNYDLATKWRR